MKKIILLGLLAIVFISACTQSPTGEVIKETQEGDTTIRETESIFTESLQFENENVEGIITKNKLTKTAELEFTQYINNTEEYTELFGEQQTLVPTAFVFSCGLFRTVIFEPERLQELGLMESSESKLQDYITTKFELNYVDKEDRQKIASCSSTGKENLDIRFYRYCENDVVTVLGESYPCS